MHEATETARGDKRRAIALAGYSIVHAFVSWTLFAWFMWLVVPAHAAMFEGARIPVPALSQGVISASGWFVRILPFAVILAASGGGLAVAVAAGLVGGGRIHARSAARLATGLLLAIALAGTVADAFVVWAMNYPIHKAIQRLNERAPASVPR